jgi:hypothetical protein
VFHLAQFFLRDPAEEPALLRAVADFIQPCRALVTFNGKSFDAPLLRTRYVTNGQDPPLEELPHLDLLPLARRLWRDRLSSRSLGSLEEHILGIARSQEDVPGWLIPDLYFDYLRDGDARPLKDVFYHNAIDILSMVALLEHSVGLLADPLHGPPDHGQVHALDLVAMAKLFESLGHADTARLLYQRGLSCDLPVEYRWSTIRRFSLFLKRQGEMRAAIDLWTEAARAGQIYAHVELAKFLEHSEHDHAAAAEWTRAAIALLDAPDASAHTRECWLAALEHRLARLRRKQARQ